VNVLRAFGVRICLKTPQKSPTKHVKSRRLKAREWRTFAVTFCKEVHKKCPVFSLIL